MYFSTRAAVSSSFSAFASPFAPAPIDCRSFCSRSTSEGESALGFPNCASVSRNSWLKMPSPSMTFALYSEL